MAKRKTQTQNSTRPAKSPRVSPDQEPQSSVDTFSTDPTSERSKNRPINPRKDSPVPQQNFVIDSSMDSTIEPRTECATKNSKDDSTDPSKRSPKDPSTDKGYSIDPSLDLSQGQVVDRKVNSSGISPAVDPFGGVRDCGSIEGSMPFKGLSITATNVSKFQRYPIFELKWEDSIELDDISDLAQNFVWSARSFAKDFIHFDDANAEVTVEIDRVQQIFDEFGQQDPHWPPSTLVERLRDLGWRCHAVTYIIIWALTTNMAVDGDIENTLLPSHILALYRDIDRYSSDTHRILGCRWIELTFGLLAGGHSKYQASAELGRRVDRIRRFLTKLLGPYCVEHFRGESFSERMNKIFEWAVATGYHLMGLANRFRWDWTWLERKSQCLGGNAVGDPPPRRLWEELPKGTWLVSPALVKETDHFGQQLAQEMTFVAGGQFFYLGLVEIKEVEIEEKVDEKEHEEKVDEKEQKKPLALVRGE